jgi:hypothetical protein
MQFSTRVRNARADVIESTIGASPVLKIRSGAKPTNMTDASTGTVLATIQLPADWMAAASNGSKSKLGTWEDASADATGIAGHYEIVAADNGVDERGTITMTGGGGDMEVQNTNFATGQDIIVTSKTYVEGNL